MIVCLDIGNANIFGGVFDANGKLRPRFRCPTDGGVTSDQLGVFLKSVLRENGIDPGLIKKIALCSVVPSIDYSLRSACQKYFGIVPFVLDPLSKIGIKIKTVNPAENGADIIAGVIAALHAHPKKDILVVDFGTVTTVAAVNKKREYLGVSFIPGIKTAMNSLEMSAAKLFSVEIIKPKKALGKTTVDSIQAGLFFGHIGAVKEITARLTEEVFDGKKPIIVATGGFAHLFEREKIFDYMDPDLVLQGIRLASLLEKNRP